MFRYGPGWSCLKKQYCARNFLSSTKFQEKSWILVHFKTIQDLPEWYRVVPSRPEFFPSNKTRHKYSRHHLTNLGSGLQSHLVLSQTKRDRERKPLEKADAVTHSALVPL